MKLGYGGGAIGDYPWHLDGTIPFTQEDMGRATNCLSILKSLDIRLVDTASRYGGGISEIVIGEALQYVEDIEVITKIELMSLQEMQGCFEVSSTNLRGKLTGVLLHNPELQNIKMIDRACEWLGSLDVKYKGISTEPSLKIIETFERHRCLLNILEFPFSTFDRRASFLFDWLRSRDGITVIVNRVLGGPALNVHLTKNSLIKALKFLTNYEDVIDYALIGTINMEHLNECAEIFEQVNSEANKSF